MVASAISGIFGTTKLICTNLNYGRGAMAELA